MKRVIFLSATALLISAAIMAQTGDQIRTRTQDPTSTRTRTQNQSQTQTRTETQAGNQSAQGEQASIQNRNKENSGDNGQKTRTRKSARNNSPNKNMGAKGNTMQRNYVRMSPAGGNRGR